jgi:hypothetical protein
MQKDAPMIPSLRGISLGLSVFSLLLGASCAGKPKRTKVAEIYPRNIAVLPVNNASRDLTAPVLVRYFLEEELKDEGFRLTMRMGEIDQHLRQLGITGGDQISRGNVQQVGQFVRAEAVFLTDLLEFSQDLSNETTRMKARFQFIETVSGNVLWEKSVDLQKEGFVKVPISVAISPTSSLPAIRSIAKSATGKLPKKLVSDALKGFP